MINLFESARFCLQETDIEKKVVLSRDVATSTMDDAVALQPIKFETLQVGRPNKPELIHPKDLPKRTIKNDIGKAAMIHSFAHIEFNAINLVWDLICRFQTMPKLFYQQWAKVAFEEANHFSLLSHRLNELGYSYGDFPAHNGLWSIAEDTRHDLLLRLAVVPRILEARGLDVTPDLINRFSEIGDDATVNILSLIYEEEIGHVQIGTEWFRKLCIEQNRNPDDVFKKIFDDYAPRARNKLNEYARKAAGFSEAEIAYIS